MSQRNSFSDLVEAFGNTLSGLVELAEKSKEFQQRSGQKPESEFRVSARSLDGSSLDDLKLLANKLKGVGQAEPEPGILAKRLVIELHEEEGAIVALVCDVPNQPSRFECRVDGDVLELLFEQGDHVYVGEAHLPEHVDDTRRQLSVRPGLVELRWPRGSVRGTG